MKSSPEKNFSSPLQSPEVLQVPKEEMTQWCLWAVEATDRLKEFPGPKSASLPKPRKLRSSRKCTILDKSQVLKWRADESEADWRWVTCECVAREPGGAVPLPQCLGIS